MSIFAIVLNEPTQDDWAVVKEHWPDRHYVLTDRVSFVAPDNGTVLTTQIANLLGINE